MNLRQGTNRAEPEINLTSLIDVVLLLLVFFMVTTSFVRESQLSIRLPEAGPAAEQEQPADTLDITVTAQGTYLVNGRPLVDARAATLRAAIRQVVPAGSTPEQVIISADAEAAHQAVVTAMDVAGRLGFTDVRIATRIAPDQDD